MISQLNSIGKDSGLSNATLKWGLHDRSFTSEVFLLSSFTSEVLIIELQLSFFTTVRMVDEGVGEVGGR